MSDAREFEEGVFDDSEDENKNMDNDVSVESEDEEGNTPTALKNLREKLKKAVAEKQEYLDGWQRARAELANSARMFEEDKKSARVSGVVRAVESLLPALVSLDRAKEAGEVPASFQGVEKQIQAAFVGLGVERIAPVVGEKFDPALHEALREVQTEDREKDHTIEAMLSTGYSIGERVIQPAHVSVFVNKS